jgi:hypothetical protein
MTQALLDDIVAADGEDERDDADGAPARPVVYDDTAYSSEDNLQAARPARRRPDGQDATGGRARRPVVQRRLRRRPRG